jgi:hypothetical protein
MARRPTPPASETVAFAALRRAYQSGRILVFTDPKIVGKPGTPAYSVTDVYAPPLILFAAGITLLATFGLLHWIIGMTVVILIWAFVQPPIVRWRAKKRARVIAFSTLDGLKAMWALGGFAVALKDWPERNCIAPKGDWRSFATDYLVDPIDAEAASFQA